MIGFLIKPASAFFLPGPVGKKNPGPKKRPGDFPFLSARSHSHNAATQLV
ncbi:conserved hypothetical protein [delta proteobacterium NaphS2]|nr:conserved hypothetical protein [delta proteobacterium NaphS2]